MDPNLHFTLDTLNLSTIKLRSTLKEWYGTPYTLDAVNDKNSQENGSYLKKKKGEA